MRKLLGSSLLAFVVGVAPVVFSPSNVSAQAAIRIQVAPPVPRVEVIPMAPSPRHVWVPGHWGWNGARHIWVGGYHDVPPYRGYTWIPSQWVNEGGYWVYRQGHWGPYAAQPLGQPGDEYVVAAPPPPPMEEVVPPPPGTGHVWLPGYHRWDPLARRHVWMPGRYRMGEPGRNWVPAHWQRTWRGWEFRQGHWR
jgi:hypothetical protein